jgi:hypothetical protein
MFALVISLDSMLSKTQQKYLMKLCEASLEQEKGGVHHKAWRGRIFHGVV